MGTGPGSMGQLKVIGYHTHSFIGECGFRRPKKACRVRKRVGAIREGLVITQGEVFFGGGKSEREKERSERGETRRGLRKNEKLEGKKLFFSQRKGDQEVLEKRKELENCCQKVKKGRKTKWIPTTVDLNNHIIVPEIDSKIDFPDRYVEDYISNFTKTPLDLSKPLWELHLINIKTSDAEAVGIFRIHHSLGDGASLISLLLAATRKTSDPNALPTVPTQKKAGLGSHNCSSLFWWLFLAIWWGLGLICHTVVDMVLFVLTILFIKDTKTPLKGEPGVELNTKRFVHRTVSMDHIKLVKNEMKMTINDVLLGVTQAGLTRYLNREYGLDANGGAAKQRPSNVLKNIRLRAAILVNIRPVAGIQDLADMMAEKSKAKWGNRMGYIMLPFSIALHEDPLEYVRQAKATIDRKKHSLEAICSYACAKLVLNLFGVKVAAAITRRVLFNTTVAFSNVPGPVEEISFYGHPVGYLAPSVYGHPQALTIHFQSYANQMTISLSVDPTVIPDPYVLCDDLEESLKLICDVIQKKHTVDAV